MIGSIIGAGVGAAAGIFGGISSSNAMRKLRKEIEAQRRENRQWFDRRVNEDATQRADAQRVLTRTEEAFRRRNRAAEGAAAVMGGSSETVAANKASASEAMADAASRVAAAGEARKDAAEAKYLQRESELRGQLNGMEASRAAAIGQAVSGVGKAAAGLSEALGKGKAGGAGGADPGGILDAEEEEEAEDS